MAEKEDSGLAVDPYDDGINETAEDMYSNTELPLWHRVDAQQIGGIQVTVLWQDAANGESPQSTSVPQ